MSTFYHIFNYFKRPYSEYNADMKKHKQREVYDTNYYRVKELLANQLFVKKVQWLKDKFIEFGCPIPKDGFGTYQEYMDWNKRYWSVYAKLRYGEEYKNKVKEITKGKDTYGVDEMNKINELESVFLPPVYGQYLENLLEEFGIDKNDKGFSEFIEYHIFLNKNTYPTTMALTKWIKDEKTGKWELFLQIFGHTRKEYLINYWDFIVEDQKSLPDYQGKNKAWEMFDRDKEIYDLYESMRNKIAGKRTKKGERPIDEEIYVRIAGKYPDISLSTIRSIITEVKKFHAGYKKAV